MNDRPFASILDPFYSAAQPLLNALSAALAACNASQDLRHRIILQAQLLAMTIVLTNKVERDELLAELDDLPDTVAHWARYRTPPRRRPAPQPQGGRHLPVPPHPQRPARPQRLHRVRPPLLGHWVSRKAGPFRVLNAARETAPTRNRSTP